MNNYLKHLDNLTGLLLNDPDLKDYYLTLKAYYTPNGYKIPKQSRNYKSDIMGLLDKYINNGGTNWINAYLYNDQLQYDSFIIDLKFDLRAMFNKLAQ
jgi:hypothetical protein